MRRLLLAVPIILVISGLPALAGELPRGQVSTDATIEAAADGTFLCTIQVTDPESGDLVAAPKLHFRSGETATTTIGSDEEGGSLKIEVVADATDASALLRVSVVREGSEDLVQQVRVRLK